MLDLKLEYEYMKEEIAAAIARCLEHQHWILGPEVVDLESKIAAYLGVKHCLGTSSGTDALVLSLRASAIKLKGQEYFDKTDEFITTPFTFTATGDAILRSGATPVFVDIDPASFNLDPSKIKSYLVSRLTSHTSRVIGIIPVHLYGQACNMDEIMSIATEYDLFVVEDVAQAFGSNWNGQKLGSIGTAGAFSFFPSKNLGSFGDGGMVATNDDQIAELVRMLIKHGGKDKYNVDHIGYNARLDTLQAAVLLAKLKYIDEFNNRRKQIAQIYTKELAGIDNLVLPITPDLLPITNDYHVFNQYTIRVLNGKRDALQQYLKEKGVGTMIYYPVPLHRMKVFENRMKVFESLSCAEKAVAEVLSLPIEPLQKKEDTAYVINCIKEYFKISS